MARLLTVLLDQAARMAQRLADDDLVPLGITSEHVAVLALLAEAGPQTQQALGQRLRLDRTAVVGLVDDLERRGYLQRRRDPADRRRYALQITAAGAHARAEAAPILAACEAGFLAPLSAAEQDQLRRFLARLLGEPEPPPIPAPDGNGGPTEGE